jgi:hypothetical protein
MGNDIFFSSPSSPLLPLITPPRRPLYLLSLFSLSIEAAALGIKGVWVVGVGVGREATDMRPRRRQCCRRGDEIWGRDREGALESLRTVPAEEVDRARARFGTAMELVEAEIGIHGCCSELIVLQVL